MVNDLTRQLQLCGHHCEVFYFDDIVELNFTCKVTQISFLKPIHFGNFDIIHSHLLRPDLYCLLYKKQIKTAGCKLICTLHTAIYQDLEFTHGRIKSRLAIPMWELALRNMDHVVFLNHTASKSFRHLDLVSSSVIPNGRDLPVHHADLAPSDLELLEQLKQKYLLTGAVSILDQRKGFEQVIELLLIQPNYAFVVVGDGPHRSVLTRLIRENQLNDRFIMLGERTEGFRYIPYFDLFLMPSRSEGLPLAVLEAMALKVPLVLSAIPELESLLSPHQAAFFELDDPSSFSQACVHASANAYNLSSNAYAHYEQFFTLKGMADTYVNLYLTFLSA